MFFYGLIYAGCSVKSYIVTAPNNSNLKTNKNVVTYVSISFNVILRAYK